MPNLDALVKHRLEKLASESSPVPNGYVWAPKGDVYATRHCDKTKASGRTLFIVYDPKTQRRVGLRCPKDIFEEVSAAAAASASSRQKAVDSKDRRDVDTARQTLIRLFPRMPLAASQQILDHSFLKGTGRVGRATTLSSDEKCTLAVVAHVRHIMTPYDQHLSKLEPIHGRADAREKAREAIRDELQAVLSKWRPPSAAHRPVHKNAAKPKSNVREQRQGKSSRRKNNFGGNKKVSKHPKRLQLKPSHVKISSENLTKETRSPQRQASILAQARIRRSSGQGSFEDPMLLD